MFETIQNSYPKVQGTEFISNNAISARSSTEMVGGEIPRSQTQSEPFDKTQNTQDKENHTSRLPEATEKILEGLQNDIQVMHNIGLKFSVHDNTGKTIIKVMDETNSTVIREIPPESVLELAEKMDEMLGILFDKKV
jgi:flagellar protein FlaG